MFNTVRMFELYLGKRLYENFKSDESSESETEPTDTAASTGKIIWTIVYVIILIGLGAYGAYISWEANTLAGWGTVGKVIFSFFAFLFGLSYLITYFIHKLDLVNAIVLLKGPPQPPVDM